jgi:hypothetical protein
MSFPELQTYKRLKLGGGQAYDLSTAVSEWQNKA